MLILKFARKTSITILTEFKQAFTKNIKYWPSWNFGQDHHLELFQVSVQEAIINGSVCLISFSECSLLIYKVSEFCMLIFCWSHYFASSVHWIWEFSGGLRGLLNIGSYDLQRDNLNSFFLVWASPFFFFAYSSLVLAKNSALNKDKYITVVPSLILGDML